MNHARSTVCGSTADGMGAGESGGWSKERPARSLSLRGSQRGYFLYRLCQPPMDLTEQLPERRITHVSNLPNERRLTFAEDLTPEDVHELEAFLNVHLGRVYDKVGPSGEISFSLRALLILVSDSAAMLAALVKVEDPDTWKRTAIVREWSRLRGTAMDFNHCDGYNHALWWEPIRHYNAADEADEQIRIRQAWGTEPDGEEGA